MCGICGFLSNEAWRDAADVEWLDDLVRTLHEPDWESTGHALDLLAQRFDDLMAFALHHRVATEPEVRQQVETLRLRLERRRDDTARALSEADEFDPALERLQERLEDYLWQIGYEVLGFVDRTRALLPEALAAAPSRPRFFLAWGLEQVLESLEKLEVRGRDSAGVVAGFTLAAGTDPAAGLDDDLAAALAERSADELARAGQVLIHPGRDGAPRFCRFLYKVANPVGRLGDNADALRRQIRADDLLWELAEELVRTNVLAHTRWASNGVINVPNCHPVDGRALHGLPAADAPEGGEADCMFVLNGDVDNYPTLVESCVHSRSARIDPAVSTDAKILPVLYRLDTEGEPAHRFRTVMQRSEGSLAVVMQDPDHPSRLFLAQKGSGQSLYAGTTRDGWVLASELYGLAARCRHSLPLSEAERGGVVLTLEAAPDGTLGHEAQYLGDGRPAPLDDEPIAIFSRDVYRGDFDYYIDKEIHEAPDSVAKTLQGKYRKGDGRVEFVLSAFGNGAGLRRRLHADGQPPVRRILAVGQGTAAMAAMGIAHLVERAIRRSGVSVDWGKGSELFGFMEDRPLDDTLVIAVSQSGTTTDTNRVVDLARSRGAWVHAIVNRRDSPLVRKSDSHLYTSNGRDVEMSVASTKAYYAQVAAGKLLALLLAAEWKTLAPGEIHDELRALEELPDKIRQVLGRQEEIARIASEYGPTQRYWALVGNGANRIAAEEIRIKLSELCYKAIPCDITEDKKHIDLSTEPLTLVVAADLPEAVVHDTVKEVAIFKAHNGKPLVLCADDETRFQAQAEALIRVPRSGGDLGFVLATVAGHLWGIEAAKAIDREAAPLRRLRTRVTDALADPADWDRNAVLRGFQETLDTAAGGRMDSALPARQLAALGRWVAWFQAQPEDLPAADARLPEAVDLLNRMIEEMTRPIDTIRHQAKTVTVGISRPRRELAPAVLEALEALDASADHLKEKDRRLLEALAPVVAGVDKALLYEVLDGVEYDPAAPPRIRAVTGLGGAAVADSRYAEPRPASGTKRKVLRTSSASWTSGPRGEESILILPLFGDDGWTCTHEVLLHLDLAPQASLEQKLEVLRHLGAKGDELQEQVEERRADVDLPELVRRASPRELIFSPVHRLVRELAGGDPAGR